jgi:DNA mismatch repair protein MutS
MRQLDAGLLLKLSVQPVTPAGLREMADRLAAPLTCAERIDARLDEVEACAGRCGSSGQGRFETVGDEIRSALKGSPDPLGSFRRLASGAAAPGDWARLVRGCDGALQARLALSRASEFERDCLVSEAL